jgi:hypothetical protein
VPLSAPVPISKVPPLIVAPVIIPPLKLPVTVKVPRVPLWTLILLNIAPLPVTYPDQLTLK